jgi:hypothetical protein
VVHFAGRGTLETFILSMAERLELTLGLAGPPDEEVQSQAAVQEQDLNAEPAPRTESPEVEILLTQPSTSRRRPREGQAPQAGTREDRLINHPRFRRVLPQSRANTSNVPPPQSQPPILSLPSLPSDFMRPPTFPIVWHGHLQDNARAMVITLQRGRIRPGEWGAMLNEVTFEGYFEGTNADQLREMPPVHPNRGARGHARWLEGQGPNILQNFGRDRRRYITLTMERILQFLDMN